MSEGPFNLDHNKKLIGSGIYRDHLDVLLGGHSELDSYLFLPHFFQDNN